MVVAVDQQSGLRVPQDVGMEGYVHPRRHAPSQPLIFSRYDVPEMMGHILGTIDRRQDIAQWRDYQLSMVYALPTMRSLKEGESAMAVVWLSGVLEVASIQDMVGDELKNGEPLYLEVKLLGGLLMIGDVDVSQCLTNPLRRLPRLLKGSVIRPPAGEEFKVKRQLWHNGRFLQELHYLPEVKALKSGEMLYQTTLVDTKNGRITRMGGLDEDGVVSDGVVGIQARLTKRSEALFIRWENLVSIGHVPTPFRSYFLQRGEVFIQNPNTTVMSLYTMPLTAISMWPTMAMHRPMM